MQRIKTTLILLVMVNLTISFIAVHSWAETPVIGFISQDTTWTRANSPYVTLGSIIVKEGVTLTVEPGVTVQFDSGHSLTIEGMLIARGTGKQGIKFTPKGDQKPGAWGGIVFEDSSIDAKFDELNYVSGSILQYCTVEFAETAVKANSASPFISHCMISNNAGRGISISKGDIVVIRDSTVADNKGGGISVEESDVITLTGNIVTGNYVKSAQGGGIYVKGGTATISNNTLTGNTVKGGDHDDFMGGDGYGGGIYISGRIYVSGIINVAGGTATISNNTLTRNTAKGGKGKKKEGDGNGGGIYAGGTTTINNNAITENRSSYNAAIAYFSSQDITSNLIANNVAEGSGDTAAVSIVGNPKFTGNTIIGNVLPKRCSPRMHP